ncbi:argininosuccinate synthase, partial [Staphylococcus simulans]
PDELLITFHKGLPTHIDGQAYELDDLILHLNQVAGKHGIGRIDHIENRLVGIKSREVYETPGAEVILKAHKALESITLTKDVAHFKPIIEKQFAEQVYNGLWVSPLTDALKLCVDQTQEHVTGEVRVKFVKGQAIANGRKSAYTLYYEELANYTK